MKRPEKEHPPENHHDAWARFERAVDVVAKSPPQHKTKDQEKKKKLQPPQKPK